MTVKSARHSPAPAPAPAPAALPPEVTQQEPPAPIVEHEPRSQDPLDHDGDGKKGGSAPAPVVTWLVVQRDDIARGLTQGEVIGVTDPASVDQLPDDLCRPATAAEVELAQPRIRLWRGPR
jgi:hypothetical protein